MVIGVGPGLRWARGAVSMVVLICAPFRRPQFSGMGSPDQARVTIAALLAAHMYQCWPSSSALERVREVA